MIRLYFIFIVSVLLLAGCGAGENRNIRNGNDSYDKSNYSEAVGYYKKALESNPASFIGKFNIADAYYKLKQYKAAAKFLKELIPACEADSAKLLQLYYNLGNTLLLSTFDFMNQNAKLSDSINNQQSLIDQESQIVEKVRLGVQLDSLITIQDSVAAAKDSFLLASIESYKYALRFDCHDTDAKYNLIYAMKYLPKDFKNSDTTKQKNTEPTEYAVKLKKQADSLVTIFKFSEAYELLNKGLLKDTTIKTYNDYIKKLKDVKDIL